MSSNANQRERGNPSITVYGRRAVDEAIVAPGVEVEHVWVSTRVPKEYRKALRAMCHERGMPMPEDASERDVSQLSGDPRHDQGVVARVRLTNVVDLDEFILSRHGKASREPTRLIGMDGVTNPQNVGMIVRSAMAAGMTGVLWPSSGTPWVNGLIIKASAGMVYRCPIVRCGPLVEALWELRAKGYDTYGLAMDGRAIDEHDAPHRAVYLVGAEATGLTEEVLAELDGKLSIPMSNGVESLNAAVASALLCYRVMR
ncbi:MAG: RNA methyltransferase [Planctomycetota bacterium]